MRSGGLATLLLAMAVTIALITGWILPTMLDRELIRARRESMSRGNESASDPGSLVAAAP